MFVPQVFSQLSDRPQPSSPQKELSFDFPDFGLRSVFFGICQQLEALHGALLGRASLHLLSSQLAEATARFGFSACQVGAEEGILGILRLANKTTASKKVVGLRGMAHERVFTMAAGFVSLLEEFKLLQQHGTHQRSIVKEDDLPGPLCQVPGEWTGG